MDKEMLEQFQLVVQGIADMENRMNQNIRDQIAAVRKEIKESESRTALLIETKVSDRIDVLFDGYKLTHEKQWELEHQTEALKKMVQDLQARVAVLENKTA